MNFYTTLLLSTFTISIIGLVSSYIKLRYFGSSAPFDFDVIFLFLFSVSIFLIITVTLSSIGLWLLKLYTPVVSIKILIVLSLVSLLLSFGVMFLGIKLANGHTTVSNLPIENRAGSVPDSSSADIFFPVNWYGQVAHDVAKKIELKQPLSENDIKSIQDKINDRFGLDKTFLFQALDSGNPEAARKLLEAGADPRVSDLAEGSARDFFYYVYDGSRRLGVPPGYTMKMYPTQFTDETESKKYDDAFNTMQADFVRAYLQSGGDSNVMMRNGTRGELLTDGSWHEQEVSIPWSAAFASMSAFDALDVLLEARANPWLPSDDVVDNHQYNDTVMYNLASDFFLHPKYLNELVDRGYFDNRSQIELQSFLNSLGAYAQRGDERSLEIQELAKRVLKRNPNYNPKTETKFEGTKRIFQNSYKDTTPGVIPWDEIKSDRVR